jgi:[protein-PII] uridylyltransferase
VVAPSGDPIRWERVRSDLDVALDGNLDIPARLEQRARSIRTIAPRAARPSVTRVFVDNDISDAATVIEVHTPDRLGVLYRITSSLARVGLDIRSARVQTLGHEVVDSFYVLDVDGHKVAGAERLASVEDAILAGLGEGPER